MATLNLTPDICFKCRYENYRKDREIACDEAGICYYTQRDIDDEEFNMDLDELASIAVNCWFDIVKISDKQNINIRKNKEQKNMYFPTLQFIGEYFHYKDWSLIPFDKSDIFYLTCLFHDYYIRTLQNANL